MDLETILNQMFPGHPAKGLPMFSALESTPMVQQAYTVGSLILGIWEKIDISDCPSDINETLKELRKINSTLLREFTEISLQAYFSNPLVVAPLQNGHAVLFPHAKVLDEMDYDLLIPVIEKYDGKAVL